MAANDNINLSVKKGSIHAIIGENGAGKSTLMNILSGVVEPTNGDIILNGNKHVFKNAVDASIAGIGMVQQEFMLLPGLSVLENIILGDEPVKPNFFIDLSKSEEKIKSICKEYGFNFDIHANIDDLPVVLQQQVEIVKVLFREAEIIILDEPTAVLPPQEIEGLFKAMKFLIAQGKTILFITHKLKEVLAVSDSITVMKLGKVVGNIDIKDATESILTNMMVGRDVMLQVKKNPKINKSREVLSCKNVTVLGNVGNEKVKNISFDLYEGEILGIVGVAGNGQTELVEAITGTKNYRGSIEMDSVQVKQLNPRKNRLNGMGYVPQDRNIVGSSPESNLVDNSLMGGHLKRFKKYNILMDYQEGRKYTNEIINKYKVKAQSYNDLARSLSGGNLQKLIVGREFSQSNHVLIIEDPVRGIDVGAIEFIWNEIIRQVEEEKVSVLLITYDLNEAMTLCDRILVIYDGEIRSELYNTDFDERLIGFNMLGGVKENE